MLSFCLLIFRQRSLDNDSNCIDSECSKMFQWTGLAEVGDGPAVVVGMDELGFYVPSTVFQSFRDDGRVNMKGSMQWSAL